MTDPEYYVVTSQHSAPEVGRVQARIEIAGEKIVIMAIIGEWRAHASDFKPELVEAMAPAMAMDWSMAEAKLAARRASEAAREQERADGQKYGIAVEVVGHGCDLRVSIVRTTRTSLFTVNSRYARRTGKEHGAHWWIRERALSELERKIAEIAADAGHSAAPDKFDIVAARKRLDAPTPVVGDLLL